MLGFAQKAKIPPTAETLGQNSDRATTIRVLIQSPQLVDSFIHSQHQDPPYQ